MTEEGARCGTMQLVRTGAAALALIGGDGAGEIDGDRGGGGRRQPERRRMRTSPGFFAREL